VNNTPVPSMPAELAASTTKPAASMAEPHVVAMRQAPLKAQKPIGKEVVKRLRKMAVFTIVPAHNGLYATKWLFVAVL
jgi:hypothetical protein